MQSPTQPQFTGMPGHPVPAEPPSYEAVTGTRGGVFKSSGFRDGPYQYQRETKPGSTDMKKPLVPEPNLSGPSTSRPYAHTYPSAVASPGVTVYHYQNPRTGHVISSLLPPDHPEMVCLQAGEHVTKSKFGVVGILSAIIWFPLGIAVCLLDRKVTCRRCGLVLHHGLLD